MKKNRRRKLILILFVVVATSLLLEVIVRISGYAERHICDPIYMPFSGSSEIPYVHKPGLINARARGLAVINTDELGLRVKSVRAVNENSGVREYRIALVGDSVTFGEGVEKNEDVYAQVMEDYLNRQQGLVKARVFNFAASAYNVAVMSATLEQRMLAVKPDVVLMAIIPNDLNLARTPSVDAYGNLSANTLSAFLSRDSRLRIPLRKIHLLYLIRDLLYPLLEKTESVEDILVRGQVPASYAYIRQFKTIADKNKLAYRIVLLPSGSQYGRLADHLTADGISFIDLSDIRNQFSRDQFQASRWDPHPSALVHRRIGESLAENLSANHLINRQE
ncbi:MAG: SGNH/GDSL hydrolase family protein [Pyrinomonadaceae bacterium]